MKTSMFCLLLVALSGCSLTGEDDKTPVAATIVPSEPPRQQNTVDYYTQKLANQLFGSTLTLKPSAGIAIGTFTQIDTLTLNSDKNHPLRLLGLQLEDGFVTATVRQGLKVIEYKTRQQLMLKADQDLMLSRQVSQLQQSKEIRYFLTGTLTEQENGVVVNAKLIDTVNNQVVAGATDYIPKDVFWTANKVDMRQNRIYRNAY